MKKTPEANVLHQQQQQNEKFAKGEHAKIVEESLNRELPVKNIACLRCNVQQDPVKMKLITQAGLFEHPMPSMWRCDEQLSMEMPMQVLMDEVPRSHP